MRSAFHRTKRAHLSRSVLSEQPVSLAVVQRDLGAFDEETAVEGERVRVDFDIAAFDVGYEYSRGAPG